MREQEETRKDAEPCKSKLSNGPATRQFDQHKKKNATFLYPQQKRGDDTCQKALPRSVDNMYIISPDKAVSMFRKVLDDMSEKVRGKPFKLGKEALRGKVFAIDSENSGKASAINLSKEFPDYMMGAVPLNESGFDVTDGVSSCIFETTRGLFAVFAVKNSSHGQHVLFQKCPCCSDFFIVCEYDSKCPEDQPLFFMGLPLRICAGCGETMEKSYKCSACRCAGLHVRYCSKVCQAKHWPRHKTVCASVNVD